VCLTHTLRKIWRHACAPITGSPAERAAYVARKALRRASGLLCTDRFCPKPRRFQPASSSVYTHYMTYGVIRAAYVNSRTAS